MLAPHEPNRDPRIHWEASMSADEFKVVVLGIEEYPGKFPLCETVGNYRIIRSPKRKDVKAKLIYIQNFNQYILNSFFKYILLLLLIAAYPFLFILELSTRLLLVLKQMATLRIPLNIIANLMIPERIKKVLRKGLIKGKSYFEFIKKLRSFYWCQVHYCNTTIGLLQAYSNVCDKPDIIHCNDLDALMAGVVLKKKYGCKLIYDAHELWPASQHEAPFYFILFFKYYEKKLLRHVDKVFTVTPQLAEIMKGWYSLDEVGVVPNAEIFIEDGGKVLFNGIREKAGERIVFLYQGNYAPGRGLEEVIKAWRHIDGMRAVLCLRGPHWGYVDQLISLAKDQIDKGSILFFPPVSESDLVASAREADVGIIPYRPVSLNNKFCCPNKLSQYMHSGLAIFANNLPYISEVIERFECGLLYDSDFEDTFISAVNRFIEDRKFLIYCKENSLNGGREHINWQVQGKPLMDAYMGIISSVAQPELKNRSEHGTAHVRTNDA